MVICHTDAALAVALVGLAALVGLSRRVIRRASERESCASSACLGPSNEHGQESPCLVSHGALPGEPSAASAQSQQPALRASSQGRAMSSGSSASAKTRVLVDERL